jgi:hypothetical protein
MNILKKYNIKIISNPFVEINLPYSIYEPSIIEKTYSRIRIRLIKKGLPDFNIKTGHWEIEIPGENNLSARIENKWKESSFTYLDCRLIVKNESNK